MLALFLLVSHSPQIKAFLRAMAEETTPNAEPKDDNAAEAKAAKTEAPAAEKESKSEGAEDQAEEKAAKTEAPAAKKESKSEDSDDQAAEEKAAKTEAPAAKKESKSEGADDQAAEEKAAKTKAPAAKKEASAKADKSAAKGKAAGKKAKEKVEDKPFNEFIEEDFTPALKEAFAQQGVEDIELRFVKEPLTISGATSQDECWQMIGKWQEGQRQFNLYFLEEDIKGQKAFSYATSGAKPSTIESFMIDERRVTLDLLVLYVLQRLNGQKWLVRN